MCWGGFCWGGGGGLGEGRQGEAEHAGEGAEDAGGGLGVGDEGGEVGVVEEGVENPGVTDAVMEQGGAQPGVGAGETVGFGGFGGWGAGVAHAGGWGARGTVFGDAGHETGETLGHEAQAPPKGKDVAGVAGVFEEGVGDEGEEAGDEGVEALREPRGEGAERWGRLGLGCAVHDWIPMTGGGPVQG